MAIKALGGDVSFTAAPTADSQAHRWHPERRERFFKILEDADTTVEPACDEHGEEYILKNSECVIISGDRSNTRLENIAREAEKHGIPVMCV